MTINNEHKKLNVPNLRFPEFLGEWEKQKLCDVSSIVGRIGFRGYTTNDIVEKGMGAIALSPTNIVNNQLTYDKENTYISMSKYEESPEIMIKRGDVIFVKTGSTVGKVAYVDKMICKTTLNPQVVVLKDIKCDNYILSVIMSTRNFQNKIQRITVGGAVPTLSQVAMGNIFISLPAAKEQEKISKFISLLDERIATQNKIIDKLQSLIKGIRHDIFKDIQGEVLTLSNIADIYQPQTISSSDLTSEGYWVYGANGIIGKYKEYNHETEQICITCRGNTCGTVNYTQPKVWITGNSMVINTDKYQRQVHKRFLFHYLSSYNFKSIVSGSGQPQIVRTPLEKIKVVLPTIEKQVRIANSIDIVSEKINTESSVLRLLENQKQYLLRQMFI